MIPSAAAFPDDGQRQPLQGLQPAGSGRAGGRPLRVPGLPPLPAGSRGCQAPTPDQLPPRQHSPRHGPPPEQPGRLVLPLQIHRHQRHGLAFQAPHGPLDPLRAAVGPHRLRPCRRPCP
jgi:hypothetical protein